MFGFSVTQPLLRGYGSKVTRSGIYIARLSQESSIHDVENQAVDLVFLVQQAYWNFVYAHQTLRVRELSVEQADTLLAYNRKGLELGTLTQSDVLEAESMLLSRHQDVLDQKRIIRDAEDSLRRVINLTGEDDWRTGIVPLDEPSMRDIEVDTAGAMKKALALRPDYKIARKQIEYDEFNRDLARNGLKPSLDLSARYNVHGSGTSYGKDVKDMGDFEQYGWNVGLVFSYPLRNRDAKAEVEKREIDIKRADLALRELENSIMTDIRAAVRNVETLRESVDVAKKNVEVNELKLRIEEERFRNQLSSSYYVLQFQKDLADSRNQYNKAVIDYMMSINELQKSQGTVLQDMNISIIGLKN